MRYKPLTRNNEFTRAYRRGASYVHPFLVTYVFKRKKGGVRIGITSSKKIGGAVVRNRARRVIREAVRAQLSENAGPYDIVLVARGPTAAQKSYRIEKVLRQHLIAAGIPLKNE